MDQASPAVVSGEGVRLELRTAGIATRAIAAAIDLAIQAAGLFFLSLIAVLIGGGSDSAGFQAIVVVMLVLVLAGYPVAMEWLAGGRTLGKMVLGLRVVRDDGGPIVFRQALVRGLVGMILEKPGLFVPVGTFAGMATVAANRREKRIGDLMAGTIVLNERAAPQPLASPRLWLPPEIRPWALTLDLSRLDDTLALRVRQFLGRAYDMNLTGQQSLGEELRHRVLDVTSPPPPPGLPTPLLLQAVLAERRRRAGEPVAPPPWAGPRAMIYPPYGVVPPATAFPGPRTDSGQAGCTPQDGAGSAASRFAPPS